MALEFAHGAVQWLAADVATTVYTISGLSFQPKALRFYWFGLQSATDLASQTVHSRRGMGFAVSTTSRVAVGTEDQDGAATTICTAARSSAAIAITVDSAPAIDGSLDLNSITSDGFTLIVDDQVPVNITVFWEAWGGSDILDAGIASVLEPAATGIAGVGSGLGNQSGAQFQPTVVFLAGIQRTADAAARVDSGLCIGAMTGPGTECIVVTGNSDDASATTDTDGYALDGECIAQIALAGGNPSARATFSSWADNGFFINWLARATSGRITAGLCIKGGSWRVGSYTINGNTLNATATVTGLPFVPKGVCLLGRMGVESTVGTSVAEDRIGLGTGTATSSRRAMGHLSENGTASSAAETDLVLEYDQVLAFPSTAGALLSAYDLNAMNRDGFQIIVDVAGGVANEWQGYIAFGDAPVPPGMRRPFPVRIGA